MPKMWKRTSRTSDGDSEDSEDESDSDTDNEAVTFYPKKPMNLPLPDPLTMAGLPEGPTPTGPA